MKTVSQLTGEDILLTYSPERPTMAIVDTEICPVEQIIMLKSVEESSIPSQAFVVRTMDGTRYVEIDTNSKEYDGTAWILAADMQRPYMTYDQCRFLTKNIITALRDSYQFEAVYRTVGHELRHARIQGLADTGSRSVLALSAQAFEVHMRSICEAIVKELAEEQAAAEKAAAEAAAAEEAAGSSSSADSEADTTTNP